MKIEKILSYNNPASKYKEIIVSIGYSLGGYNYFTGDHNARGYKLYLTPCSSGDRFRETTLLGSTCDSGVQVHLKDTNRYNAKLERKIADLIMAKAETIVQLFEQGKGNEILDLCKQTLINI